MASANKQHNNTRELLHLYLNNCTINQHVPPDHHTLQFASGSMHLQDILHNWSHDVDDTRYYLLTTLHDLLLSMKDKNTLQTYIPAAKKTNLQAVTSNTQKRHHHHLQETDDSHPAS
jgi:hypothetical protein